MKNGGKGNGSLWTLISLVILALFLLFVVYPLGLILCKSIIAPDGSGLSLEYFGKFFSRKCFRRHWSSDGVCVKKRSDSGKPVPEYPDCDILLVASVYRRVRLDTAAGKKWLHYPDSKSALSCTAAGNLRFCRNCTGVLPPVFSPDLYVYFRSFEKPGQFPE